MVEAWVNTKMERDKQILAISSLGLGGLVSFSAGLNGGSEFFLWITASLFFVISILMILIIFEMNGKLIHRLINGRTTDGAEAILKILDKTVIATFLLAVCLTFGLAINKSNFEFIKQTDLEKVIENDR